MPIAFNKHHWLREAAEFMYCCLAEIKCSKGKLPEYEIEQLKETIKLCLDSLYLDSADQSTAFRRRILWLASVETNAEVEKKLAFIKERFEKKHGPFVNLTCGFAEIRNDDLLGAMEEAKQMLARTTDTNPITGIYRYSFSKI
ncbi:MAG: hypothetical protein LLF87_01530 [Eubacteriales bacterium]|nr:hypothetical protein [Eubacteriales bacterium]